MNNRKLTTSFYHPQTKGGIEGVNDAMAQMSMVSPNERQDDWDIVLPHVEFAYDSSVRQATGLAANDVHIGRILHLRLSVMHQPAIGGPQRKDRDQFACCNLAVDR